MKLTHRFTGSLLIAALSLSPLAALATEGKKGLDATDVRLPQGIVIDIPSAGNRDDTDPDNAPEEKERGVGQDSDGNSGLDRGIGHTLIVKKAEKLPAVEIGLPRTKGTVKFFNESKSVGGKVIDILIKVNGSDI